MKNLFLLNTFIILALTGGYNCYSQRKITDFAVKIHKPIEVHIYSDSLGNIGVIFQSNKQYEIDFLSADYTVLQTSISAKLYSDKNQEIIGGVFSKGICSAYFYDDRLKAISVLSANKSDGQTSYSKVKVFQANEDYLSAFEMNDVFYVLTVIKNSSIIRVYEIKDKESKIRSFEIAMPGFYSALVKEKEAIRILHTELKANIQEINYDLDNNIHSAHSPQKLYHYDNKIIMTFDEPAMTHLITIDLNSEKSEYKKLNFDLEKGNEYRNKKGSSFMYQNKLFRSTLSHEQLNISILNLDSMTLIYSYNFYPNEEIKILNSPIIEKEYFSYYNGTEENILKKSSQFFRSALDGDYTIVANKIDSNRYEIQLGSYEVRNVSNNSAFRGGPQVSIGIGLGGGYPYSGFGYPGPFPGYYNNHPSIKEKTVYFKSLIDQETFEHISGNVPANMKERIADYESNVFKNNVPEVRRITSSNNTVILGYYVKNMRKFNIVEFKR